MRSPHMKTILCVFSRCWRRLRPGLILCVFLITSFLTFPGNTAASTLQGSSSTREIRCVPVEGFSDPSSPSVEAQSEPIQPNQPLAAEMPAAPASQDLTENQPPSAARLPPPTDPSPAPASAAGESSPASAPDESFAASSPPPDEQLRTMQMTLAALASDEFVFRADKAPDPFKPFIEPADSPTPHSGTTGNNDDEEAPPEPSRPLTPLQKMTLAEIEAGLRAITWSEYGRRAIIEDSTGKGYIVAMGTPAGDRNGVISQIFNDRLVIQQENWDRQTKRMITLDSVVKLKKKESN